MLRNDFLSVDPKSRSSWPRTRSRSPCQAPPATARNHQRSCPRIDAARHSAPRPPPRAPNPPAGLPPDRPPPPLRPAIGARQESRRHKLDLERLAPHSPRLIAFSAVIFPCSQRNSDTRTPIPERVGQTSSPTVLGTIIGHPDQPGNWKDSY